MRKTFVRLGIRDVGLLLAVSGGADSTALLVASCRVAQSLGLQLSVLTMDHGLRAEAARECARVRKLADGLGIPCSVGRLKLAKGPGLEARARERRYEALEARRVELGFDWVATAHTASDQAETLLMRMVRGTALRGAAAVQEVRGAVVRPLLSWTRTEVEAYLAARREGFVLDPMNHDPAFLRVRIRREVLPELTRVAGYDVTRALAQLSRLAAEDDALLSGLAEAARTRLGLGTTAIDAIGLDNLLLPLKRRVIADFLSHHGVAVDFERVQGVVDLLKGGPAQPVGGDRTMRLNRGRLELTKNPARKGRAAKDSVRYRLGESAQRLSKGQ